MSLIHPTFLVTTILVAGDTEQKILSVLVTGEGNSEKELDYLETIIAASLHSGTATDLYGKPSFERVDGVILYPDHQSRKSIDDIDSVRLLSHLPRFTDIELKDIGEDIIAEANAFIELHAKAA